MCHEHIVRFPIDRYASRTHTGDMIPFPFFPPFWGIVLGVRVVNPAFKALDRSVQRLTGRRTGATVTLQVRFYRCRRVSQQATHIPLSTPFSGSLDGFCRRCSDGGDFHTAGVWW